MGIGKQLIDNFKEHCKKHNIHILYEYKCVKHTKRTCKRMPNYHTTTDYENQDIFEDYLPVIILAIS